MTAAALAGAGPALLAAFVALAAATLLLVLEARRDAAGPGADRETSVSAGGRWSLAALTPLVALVPLAAGVAGTPLAAPAWPALGVGLVVAVLMRGRGDLLHSECGIKLLWVMGGALALSWAGLELLALATATTAGAEQWVVLGLGLEPRFLWSTALPLSLLVGLVLLGGAPFHFWPADLFQGSRPWLAPLAVAALQAAGAGWLVRRLEGVDQFPAASGIAGALLAIAALGALVVGAATLVAQRRPERRVGTLASLNGGLALAALATAGGGDGAAAAPDLGAWAAHLVLALSGAATLSRFMPVSVAPGAAGPVLARRHPWCTIAGLYAVFSLAGVPGTPGAWLWLGIARNLIAGERTDLALALGIAWLAAFSVAVRQLHEAFGVRVEAAAPARPVPGPARAAIWLSAAGLIVVGVAGLAR